MEKKTRKFKQITTLEDRKIIERLLKKNYKPSVIADVIEISEAGIYREIKRGKLSEDQSTYSAEKAQKDYEEKKKKKFEVMKLRREQMAEPILRNLNELMRIGSSKDDVMKEVNFTLKTLCAKIKEGTFPDISTKFYFERRAK